ncbi:GAF domain-containing protein [Aureimonas leprariae]|uniref:GAF domain-containing protein n=1 Tax=Plantimonas leprariae TaxID=2615207 RepID=A0A7V7TVZ7_9HYPH|nr:GAF domain-containing protein [Aureimonas leprariae]KAB0678789.1 GAF domain-containing protein [Aureimonas leprariae]
MTEHEIIEALAAFDRRIAEDVAPDALWTALQDLARQLVGAKLFTVTRVHMAEGLVRREYTSDPEAYPVSGTKPIHRDRYFEVVHEQHRPFVANTIAEIATVFPDHETIASLGCGSVLNLPAFLGGEIIGTVNCLDVEHHYTPERVERSRHLALPAKLAFLAADGRARSPGA